MCESLAYYEAIKDYEHPTKSTDSKYLMIRAGNIIEVDLSLNKNLSTKEWMVGRIRGTNEVGLFPMNRVKIQEAPKSTPNIAIVCSGESSSIKSAEWYWGDISNKQGNGIILDTSDGSFLVRDSSEKDENNPYTLVLRNNHQTALMHIYYADGKYGLYTPLEFNSVKDLIEYYSHNSLKTFNRNLNLKLGFPIPRPLSDSELEHRNIVQLRREFISTCMRYHELEKNTSLLYEDEEKFTEELSRKRSAIETHEAVRLMFSEQLTCFSKTKFFGEVLKIAVANSETIKERISSIESTLRIIRHDLVELEGRVEVVKIKLNKNISEMIECNLEREKKERLLTNCGETVLNLTLIRKGHDIVSKETIPHLNESLWLLGHCDRARAECLLINRPKGTFLIRHRSRDSYALSIVSENRERTIFIAHCEINKKDSGYGFAEPFYIYKDLCDLVLHYKDTSLYEHNDELDVTMEFPVFMQYR